MGCRDNPERVDLREDEVVSGKKKPKSHITVTMEDGMIGEVTIKKGDPQVNNGSKGSLVLVRIEISVESMLTLKYDTPRVLVTHWFRL
jgi:hypothetical protein